MSRALLFAVVLLVCASCAKGTPLNPILGPGESPTPMVQPEYIGIGKYQELAAFKVQPQFGGVPFASFIEVRQSPGREMPHRDLPGFVYAYQGSVILSRESGEGIRQTVVNQGGAKWVDTASEYTNGSNDEQIWYFVALRSILQRSTQLPYASYRSLYMSSDLPQVVPDKPLVYQLGYITMDVGGRTSAHSHGVTEVFYVIKGTVVLATNDGQRVNVTAGQGASIKPGVVMQLRVVGEQPVQILSFFVTSEGAPWQTNVQTLP